MISRGGRLASSSRRALCVLPLWVASTLWLWLWWINGNRINYLPLFVALTLALLYEFFFLPSIFLYFLFRAKTPPKRIAPKNKKVAVITPCVPSKESLDVIEAQLKKMIEIEYPHDSWILDEGNSKPLQALAKKYKVKYFSRKGIQKYNQNIPPFKAKTKAGNINAWLDHVKKRNYEYFLQLDIDHQPTPRYLHKTLGYFRNENIAWVQSPSIYKNLQSWTARGAAEQELVLQGPLQMGFYGHSETPFIIGSHCVYRMSAIKEIGGFQPTRAEDHLDTVVLASKGYHGVFLPEVIAEGDGPDTLTTFLGQQFAWAYSMFQVLVQHTPTLIKTMKPRQRLQFLFAETWYPIWSLAYFIMFICPIIALFLGKNIANVGQLEFVEHFVPVFLCTFLVWWAARPLMQPKNVFLSWRGMILHAVRWPVVLKAVISSAMKVTKPYMITPKGKYSDSTPSLATYRPFLLLGLLSTSAVIFASLMYGDLLPLGPMVFAIVNSIFMLLICLVDLNISLYKLKQPLIKLWRIWLKPAAATATLAISIFLAIVSPFILNRSAFATSTVSVIKSHLKPTSQMSLNEIINQINKLPDSTTDPLPSIGIYNESSRVYSSQNYIDQTFASWSDDRYIAAQLYLALKQNNTPLLSIDPTNEVNISGNQLLQNTASGVYDDKLSELATIISATKRPVYVRFAHEMDLANVYPWGGQDPALFINAYQHVVNYIRAHGATNAQWVWSPAGNNNATAYYPGDNYVDVIGTTIIYDQYWYGNYQPTFNEIASPRTWLEQYGKPVWIVEFGAGNTNPVFQKQLIGEAVDEYKSLRFSALIYINMIDANTVGPNYLLSNVNEFSSILSSDPIYVKHTDIKKPAFKKIASTQRNVLDIKLNTMFLLNQNLKNQTIVISPR